MNIAWVFDVLSPFSYLSIKHLHRLPSSVTVRYVPVLLAGLLNHFGQIGNGEIASKRRFTYRFVVWRARQLGIPLALPPAHPFNPLQALRLVIAAGSDRRAAECLLDAVFMHGRDVTDAQVLAELGNQLGVSDVQRALNDPAIKRQLRDNTDWAISKGVFGVPTFVVGDEIFWGHDSLDMVLDYLANPDALDDPLIRAIDTLPVGAVRSRNRDAGAAPLSES